MKFSAAILTWNNLENTKIFFNSLYYAEDIIKHILVVDNGSDDGTIDYLEKDCPVEIELINLEKNFGISIAKNRLVDRSLELGCKYMFMFDNDVAVIPGSLTCMVDYMEKKKNVGCFGHRIDNFTNDINDKRIPAVFVYFDKIRISKNVKSGYGAIRAWTHYSIYRVDLFKQGVRFDENGPFGQAGYGFDDDDLGNQIAAKGYDIACFEDIFCYHNINSCIPNLKKTTGLNFCEREKYFKEKWKDKLRLDEK